MYVFQSDCSNLVLSLYTICLLHVGTFQKELNHDYEEMFSLSNILK